jgi:hypothetical protein
MQGMYPSTCSENSAPEIASRPRMKASSTTFLSRAVKRERAGAAAGISVVMSLSLNALPD